MRIRTKLFLLLSGLTLIPLILLGTISYSVARSAVEEKVKEQLFKVSEELAGGIEDKLKYIDGVEQECVSDRNFELYAAYVGKKDVGFLTEIIQKTFEYYISRGPDIVAMEATWTGKREGPAPLVPAPAGSSGFSGDSDIAVIKGAVSAPPRTTIDGIFPAGPVGNEASVFRISKNHGATAFHVYVKAALFSDVISRAAIGEGKPVAGFLIAPDDREPDHPAVHGKHILSSDPANNAVLSENFSTSGWLSYGGRVAAIRQVGHTGFYVGASMREDEFLAPVRRVRNLTMLIIAIVAGLVIASSLVFATTIVRPISEMVAVTHRVAEGNLDARLETVRRDELGDLSRDFNAMTEKLKTTIGNLDRRIRELTSLYEASALINQSADIEEVLTLTSELLESGFGVTDAVFLKSDGEGSALLPIHIHGQAGLGGSPSARISALAPLVQKAFESTNVLGVETNDPEAAQTFSADFIKTAGVLILVPLFAGGRKAGLIVITGCRQNPDDEARRIFSVLGSLISPLFVTAESAAGHVLYDAAVRNLRSLGDRVDRLDSRLTVAAVKFKTAIGAESRERIVIAAKELSPHVFALTPHLITAFFPGLSAPEAQAQLGKVLADQSPKTAAAGNVPDHSGNMPVIRTLCYPEDGDDIEDVFARCLELG